MNVIRMRIVRNHHQSNLENTLQQFPHLTEKIEIIESYIRFL